MTSLKVLGRKVRANEQLYEELRQAGFHYVLNPKTHELHRVGLKDFWGSHNLANANLSEFIYLVNLDDFVPIHQLPDETRIPIYDLQTEELLGDYVLDKCRHCFG